MQKERKAFEILMWTKLHQATWKKKCKERKSINFLITAVLRRLLLSVGLTG